MNKKRSPIRVKKHPINKRDKTQIRNDPQGWESIPVRFGVKGQHANTREKPRGTSSTLSDDRLSLQERHMLATTIGNTLGNKTLKTILPMSSRVNDRHLQRTVIQRALTPREKLQKKYGIKIENGNKAWSASDIKDLKWVFAKLNKSEAAAINGYRVVRWSTPAARQKVDPTYKPQPQQECGFHEADIRNKSFKIHMYDQCFDKSTTIAGVAIGRFNILHEIGHAMEIAEYRQLWEKYKAAEAAYNASIDAYNAKRTNENYKKYMKLKRKMEKADKKQQAAFGRTIKEFGNLIKKKTPLTTYSKTNTNEAFAEAFALFKIDPKGIKRRNRKLGQWFQKSGHLK
jgi:hypothetical protein